jgi:hypothetical protein
VAATNRVYILRSFNFIPEPKQFGRNAPKSEKMVGVSISKDETVKNMMDQTVEERVRHIEDTFTKANRATVKQLKHPNKNKRDVEALEIVVLFTYEAHLPGL